MEYGSREVCIAAVKLALTQDRDSENTLKKKFADAGIKTAAVDFGGEFSSSVGKIIERIVVAARREDIIGTAHNEEGSVAGAARDALSQLSSKAMGLNVGGKIAVSRYREHISVCVFIGIGLLHLNDMAIAAAHRAV